MAEGSNGTGVKVVTPAAEWRRMREEGVQQTLLSGRVVRLRTVTPDRLLKTGRVPDILTPIVTKMLFEEVDNDELNEFIKPRDNVADNLAMIEGLNVVCQAGMLYPRIVDNPQAEDEISIDDLTLADRGWVFKLVFQPAEVLARFRIESLGDVEAGADGKRDEQPSE